jgi:hypothetical protein
MGKREKSKNTSFNFCVSNFNPSFFKNASLDPAKETKARDYVGLKVVNKKWYSKNIRK